jgi:TolB-like protein/DNA-binding winged helix-turn-helix (wHTH) protein
MPAERFEFEDFELDRSAYELRRAGTVVHLERIPLELLFLLIERRGQLVTRQEIFERIWGKGVFVDTDNSINTAVNKIRRTLNDDADKPRFVVTVPAKGYRFIAPIREEDSTLPVREAGPVSAVAEPSPTADAVDTSPITIAKADMPLRKDRRKGILWSIGGIAFVIAVIALIQQVSLRGPTTTASNPTTQSPALPLPDKPSLAGLPFANMSGDREQEYFSDGITDGLTTALSRLPDLFVIARTSAFTYKGKAVKVQDVSRELGVKYLLEGSVEKAGGQVRITAQLVDATTGEDLWAEQYERPLRDIFVLQDEVVGRIVTTLKLQLTLEERGILVRKQTDNPEAYDDFLRGQERYWALTKQGNAQARKMFEKAIELDPRYADAYVALGFAHLLDYILQWISDPHALDRAFQMAQRAVALDDSLPLATRYWAVCMCTDGSTTKLLPSASGPSNSVPAPPVPMTCWRRPWPVRESRRNPLPRQRRRCALIHGTGIYTWPS